MAGGVAIGVLLLALAAEAAPATVPVSALVPAPSLRGVLFRVTPPAAPGPTCVTCEARVMAPLGWLSAAEAHPRLRWWWAAGSVRDDCPVERSGSLILGTIHFGSRDEQGLAAVDIETLLDDRCALVVEARPPTAWTDELDAHRLLPEGQGLSTLISAEGIEMARSLLPGYTPELLDRLRPWAVLALLEARGDVAGDASLDAVLLHAALARAMPVVTLETLEDQLAALDCVEPATHAGVLEERLLAPWILKELSARALHHYHQRDLSAWLDDVDRMVGLGEQSRQAEQVARECLLEQRNARWLPRLIEILSRDGQLVAVGALHLVGEQGLLSGLSKAGFRVEVVPL